MATTNRSRIQPYSVAIQDVCRLLLSQPQSLLVLSLGGLALAGCSNTKLPVGSGSYPSTLPTISGKVYGGQQPISGATIQLYAAGTTALKGFSTALLTATVTTDATGGFNITGDYTCPSSDTLVYLVATGGNPGLPGTVDNTAIALMSVLGTCGTLTNKTFISINELTTVASVESLAPFMADLSHVGASAANPSALTTAFESATAFVDPGTGQFRTTPTSPAVPPIAMMNTLSDVLAACVNTVGGAVGDGTVCGNLFQYTSSTSNVLEALLKIVRSPTINVTQIYGLIPAVSPFQPIFPSVPTSFAGGWSLSIGNDYNNGDQIVADSQFHIWVLQPSFRKLSQYDSNLNLLHTYSSDVAGDYIALDSNDNLWVDLGSSLIEFGSDGSLKSPSTGYVFSNGSNFINGDFAIDSLGNVWGVVYSGSNAAWCVVEYSASGVVVSPAAGYCGSQTFSTSGAPNIVADSSSNVYLLFGAHYSGPDVAIEKFTSSGSFTDIQGGTSFSALLGYGGLAVYDPRYNHIWTFSVYELANLSLDGNVNSSLDYPSDEFEAVYNSGLAIDAGGDLWLATDFGTLAEFDPQGNIISKCSASSNVEYPLLCGIPADPTTALELSSLAIDPAGDVFTIDATNGALLKFPGLATAK